MSVRESHVDQRFLNTKQDYEQWIVYIHGYGLLREVHITAYDRLVRHRCNRLLRHILTELLCKKVTIILISVEVLPVTPDLRHPATPA